jgi:uncharacterized protein (DUF1800 family)
MGTTIPTTMLPGSTGAAEQLVFSPTIDDLSPYTGAWGEEQVVHLLKRCLFGAKKQDVDYFKALTMTQAVNEILQPASPSAQPPLNNYSVDGYTDPSGVALWQTWIDSGIALADKDLNEKRIDSFKTWWLGRLLTPTRSIHEKLTVFWHNHFATNTSTATDKIKARFWYDHYLTLSQHALGNFKSMAKAITIDPAMLYFLNGESNINTSPNENYARELQELYTAGKGPGSMYTEDDVRYAARVLTGHTVSDTTFNYYFDAGKHDTGNKEFSNFYSNAVITGYSGAAGAGELDSLLNMIFQQPEVARHICRKIYRHFVYYKIDAEAEQKIIAPMAQIFRNSNYDIKAVLTALFTSKHFYEMAYSAACIIKSPIDFVIDLVNEFEVALPPASDNAAVYATWELLQSEAREMQQELGAIPEVAGWYAYYQEPAFHEMWINSATYTRRAIFTDRMITDGLMRNGTSIVIDPIILTDKLPGAANPDTLIAEAVQLLLRYPLTDGAKTFIKRSILLSGQTDDSYWSNAWNTFKMNPNDMVAKNIVVTRLTGLYKYIMNLPEYHLS